MRSTRRAYKMIPAALLALFVLPSPAQPQAAQPQAAQPQAVQPEAADPLSAIVRLSTKVPAEARTARGLGTVRKGSGVVIDDTGLVLTIGYLVLEAS